MKKIFLIIFLCCCACYGYRSGSGSGSSSSLYNQMSSYYGLARPNISGLNNNTGFISIVDVNAWYYSILDNNEYDPCHLLWLSSFNLLNGYIKGNGSGVFSADSNTFSLSSHNHSGLYEPVISSGTTSQYWRGDKTWQTLDVNDTVSGTELDGVFSTTGYLKRTGSATYTTDNNSFSQPGHAHLYSDINESTSANWATRVSNESGEGVWIFVDINSLGKNDTIKWTGSRWRDANTADTYTWSISSFSHNAGTSAALIGGSTTAWKSAGTISFSASYYNPPPTTATVNISGAGGSWNSALDMGSPTFEGPTVSAYDINYPSTNGTRITFTLSGTCTGDPNDSNTIYSGYFYNHFVYDDLEKNSGFSDANIDEMAAVNEIISSTTARTFTLSIAAANYLCFAHRTGDTAVAQVLCGATDDTNRITVAMNKTDVTAVTPLKETVSHSNIYNKIENFFVYSSYLQNIDAYSTTFTTSTSTTAKNLLYWGVTSTASGYAESDVEGLAYYIARNITSDYTLPNTVTLSNQYLLICFPSRLGDNGSTFTFKDGGTMLPLGMESPEHVIINNACGFRETYHVWRSTQLLTTSNLSILVDF